MRFRSKSLHPPTHNQGVLGSSPSGTASKLLKNQIIRYNSNRLISFIGIPCVQFAHTLILAQPYTPE